MPYNAEKRFRCKSQQKYSGGSDKRNIDTLPQRFADAVIFTGAEILRDKSTDISRSPQKNGHECKIENSGRH